MINPWRHILSYEPWIRLGVRGLFVASLWVLLLCTSCTRMRTVTVPAQESTVNMETDTVQFSEYPPVPLGGQTTLPSVRAFIDDTSSGPTIDVSRVEVDNRPDESGVRILWRRGEETIRDEYDLPVYGEMLVWTPKSVDQRGYFVRSTDRPRDTPDMTEKGPIPLAEIIGSPQKKKVKADVTTAEPPWYRKMWTWMRMMFAFALGAVVSYVVVKLVPGL